MVDQATNSLCKAHSGFEAKIETLEGNVSDLWSKWNGMQRIVLAIFVTLSLNLVALLFLLLKTFK
jgi:hypothetical protein